MLIVVLGLPGSGKSFLAEKLSQRIQAAYLNTDIVRIQLRKRGAYRLADKEGVYAHLAQLAEQALQQQTHVVVDGTFSRQPCRRLMLQLAATQKTGIRWIKTHADEAVIRSRVSKRRKHSEADFAVYLKVKEEFEPLNFPYLSLDSVQDTPEEMLNKAEDYIFSTHDDSAIPATNERL